MRGVTLLCCSSRLMQFMTPEAESHHDQRSGASCDGTGPCFAHLLLHLLQLPSVVPHYQNSPSMQGSVEAQGPAKCQYQREIVLHLLKTTVFQILLSTFESRESSVCYLRVLSLGTEECRGG